MAAGDGRYLDWIDVGLFFSLLSTNFSIGRTEEMLGSLGVRTIFASRPVENRYLSLNASERGLPWVLGMHVLALSTG